MHRKEAVSGADEAVKSSFFVESVRKKTATVQKVTGPSLGDKREG